MESVSNELRILLARADQFPAETGAQTLHISIVDSIANAEDMRELLFVKLQRFPRARTHERQRSIALVAAVALVSLGCTDWSKECDAAFQAQDYESAAKSCAQAAENGDASAQYNLGWMYAVGEGVPEDDAKTFEWYTKAAEQGDALGQLGVGRAYAEGEGVPEDKAKAVEWLTKSAEQGRADAQYILGGMYHFGEGVPASYVRAHAWFSLAAAQGRDAYIQSKAMCEMEMSKEQIAEAQKLATELYEKIRARKDGD